MPKFSGNMRRIALILAGLGAAVVLFLAIFSTFIDGRTSGPDFIEAIQSGKLNTSGVESIEVFAPQVGSMPFRGSEYARLKKLAEIGDPYEIKRILESLAKAEHDFPSLNHPVCKDICYLRINTETGWYWIYCDLLDDGRYRGLKVNANTLHATNPNGGRRYFLEATEDILAATRMKN
jgi:hypothetical protein